MSDDVTPPPTVANEFFIQGVTNGGKQFRPSDWAERLCGVMSCFEPENSGGLHTHLKYSRYVRPTMLNGVKSVVVDEALRQIEPLAFHFLMNFAKDNELQIISACLLPDSPIRPER